MFQNHWAFIDQFLVAWFFHIYESFLLFSLCRFKNVIFEISPSESVGVFDVKAKLMGVHLETLQLEYQDLLQLQYEGVAVMKLFDRATINVNLLIFLLNKKFYGK